MWNVVFVVEASSHLSPTRRHDIDELLRDFLQFLDPPRAFALVTFSREIAGYRDGTFRPLPDGEHALLWLERAPAQGPADLSPLLERLVQLPGPCLVVYLSCSPPQDQERLLRLAGEAPSHLCFLSLALGEDSPFFERFGERFSGGYFHTLWSPKTGQGMKPQLLRELVLGPVRNALREVWYFKHQLDGAFSLEQVQSETTRDLLETFERALLKTGQYEHAELVRSGLESGRGGFAYAWFGGALAFLESLTAELDHRVPPQPIEQPGVPNLLPKPQGMDDFIRALESELLRKRVSDAQSERTAGCETGAPHSPRMEYCRSWSALPDLLSRDESDLVILSEQGFLLSSSRDTLLQIDRLNISLLRACSLEGRLYNMRRGQFDADQLLADLGPFVRRPVLLLVREDLYRKSQPEWRFCLGHSVGYMAVLSSHRLKGESFDKMLARYAAKALGKFQASSDPASIYFEPLVGLSDVARMKLPLRL